MEKRFDFSDYCPTKDKVMEVGIAYVESTCLEDYVRVYSKGENLCPWKDECGKCPVWENAPQDIRG